MSGWWGLAAGLLLPALIMWLHARMKRRQPRARTIMDDTAYWDRVRALPKADPHRFDRPANPCEGCGGSGWAQGSRFGRLFICYPCGGSGHADLPSCVRFAYQQRAMGRATGGDLEMIISWEGKE